MKQLILTLSALFLLVWGAGAQTTVSQTFTANGSFQVPPGVTSVTVKAWGGGGG